VAVRGAVEPSPARAQREHEAALVTALLVIFGAALAALAVSAGWGRDFASFYGSAASLARGSDPYRSAVAGGAININLPHVTAILVPFTFLPFGVAFGLWQAVQLAAWGGLLFVLLRENPALPRPEFIAAAALFPGTLAQIAQGQWGFVLAWLIGLAWTAHRRQRELQAGIWIGVACAVKPFVGLLLLAYLRQARVRGVAAAATVVGLVFAGGLLALGPGVYVEWARAVSGIEWAGYPSNASLLGLAERTLPSDAVGWFWPVASLLVAGTTLVACGRRSDEASSWALVLVAALLVSPVGWLYYGWIAAPALLALGRWRGLLKAGLLLLWLPPGLLPALSTASIGLVMVWAALMMEIRSPTVRPGGPP
jgi:hypothetical protein